MAIEFRSHRQEVFDPIKNFSIYRDEKFYDLKKGSALIYFSGDLVFGFDFKEIFDLRNTNINNIPRRQKVVVGVTVFERTILKGLAANLGDKKVSSEVVDDIKNNIANGLNVLINFAALDAPLVADFFVEFSSAEI